MDLGLADKVSVVVGGTSGMGHAAAECLAEEGSKVVLVARDGDRASVVADHLKAQCEVETLGLHADGRVPGTMEHAMAQAHGRFGRIDNLAVMAGPVTARSMLLESDDSDWDDYFQGHLMLTVRACRAALPHLLKGGGNIVTAAAYSVRDQKPAMVAYTAMKSAVASLTKNLAKTHGPDRVRANCICPGAIITEGWGDTPTRAMARYGVPLEQAAGRWMQDEWHMSVALERPGYPREVGELVAFLLSDRAAYLTGALINIDGGTNF